MHEYDRRNKLDNFAEFENKTLTHMDATNAISNSNYLYPQNPQQTFNQFQ